MVAATAGTTYQLPVTAMAASESSMME